MVVLQEQQGLWKACLVLFLLIVLALLMGPYQNVNTKSLSRCTVHFQV